MVNQPGECKIVTFTIHDNPVGKKGTKISLELIGKERIKEALQEQLLKAKDMEDFTRTMAQAGIRVEKGRGIAFIDDKNERVKCSSLGYQLK